MLESPGWQNNWRQSSGSWGTILCLVSSYPGAQAETDTALCARCRELRPSLVPTLGASQSCGLRAAAGPPAPGRTGMAAVLRPVGCRQGTQPAGRRGVRAASGGARDSQVEEALVGVSQETGVLYFLYSGPRRPCLRHGFAAALY